jgi:Protein of unknown function (DUF1580)
VPPIDGVRPNISTVWRWATTGIKGVKLESVVVAGRRCTTMKAYREFAASVAAGNSTTAETPAPTPRKAKRLANAAEILKAAGIRRPQMQPA